MDTVLDPRLSRFLRWAGTFVAGDVGPVTVYTTRRLKRVFYPRTTPPRPATARQRRCRDRFGLAVRNYFALPQADRDQWELLAHQLGIIATGQSIYLSLALNADRSQWATAVARTGTTLTPPDYLPA